MNDRYRALAKRDAARYAVIEADRPAGEVHKDVLAAVLAHLRPLTDAAEGAGVEP